MKIQLPNFSGLRIAVYGDVMLDRYWHGNTNRISPEAPVPVVHVRELVECPGGAGNVALNIAALGAKVSLFGTCGEDSEADILYQKLLSRDVEPHLLRVAGLPTVTKLRVLSVHQQLLRLDFEENFSKVDNQPLIRNALKRLPQMDALVLSDYAKGGLTDPQSLIAAANQFGVPVLVDPKRLDFAGYRGATIVTPNFKEFTAVVGDCPDDETLYAKGLQLLQQQQFKALLVTRGERGMTLIQKDFPPFTIPTKAREVFDVTGAGDTVVAVLAAAMAAQQDLTVATRLANLAAGVVVGKLGAAHVSRAELGQALHREQLEYDVTIAKGIVSQPELMDVVAQVKAEGETVVYASGCFDLLHPGHIRYLQQAKAQGDRLIVAVYDDDMVRLLKGENRPYHDLAQRMAVVAGLRSVDWVVSVSKQTVETLVCRILPNVLVKSRLEHSEAIAGAECVAYGGGQVKMVDIDRDFSSDALVARLQAE